MRRYKNMAILAVAFAIGTPFFSVAGGGGATCIFDEEIAALKELKQAGTSGSLEVVRTELDLRKNILKKTIVCGREDFKEQEAELQAMVSNDRAANAIRDRYVSRLKELSEFYASAEGKIDSLGVRGTQVLAEEIASWRANEYSAFKSAVKHFGIWHKNQDLFVAAGVRLEDIERSLSWLRLSDSEEIRVILAQARSAFDEAEELNFRAEVELRRADAGGLAVSLIKRSLERLSAAYKAFFDLGEAVNREVTSREP